MSKFTWGADMIRALRSGFGLWQRRPASAPESAPRGKSRIGLNELRRAPHPLDLVARRFDYHVAGLELLEGVPLPLVFAVNQQGPMDFTVLSSILPTRMRTTQRRADRALSKGRSVVVFSNDPLAPRRGGEFSDEITHLALQHNIPIVPVGVHGTFNVGALLKVGLSTKPQVSIRFGAPIYAHGRPIPETTREVQACVEALLRKGEVTWWDSRRRSDPDLNDVVPQARWLRSWELSASEPPHRSRVWPARNSGKSR